MVFFELNKRWKVWIYRLGLFYMCLGLLGLILVAINANYHYGSDIIKRNKNPMFNGRIEKFFYLIGWLVLLLGIIVLIDNIFQFVM